MNRVNEILKAYPSAKIIPFSSGCPEMDSKAKPFEIWCGGSTLTAEANCTTIQNNIASLGETRILVDRVGPRTLKVKFS